MLSLAGMLSSEHRCPAWSEHGDVASTPQQRGEEGQGAPVFCGKVCFGGKAFGGLRGDWQSMCFSPGATPYLRD